MYSNIANSAARRVGHDRCHSNSALIVSKKVRREKAIFANPLWELFVDVTPDGAAHAVRMGNQSPQWSDVWVEAHPSHPGWMFIKARLDLTGAADVDVSLTVHMTEADQGDALFPLGDFTMIRLQDLTVEVA